MDLPPFGGSFRDLRDLFRAPSFPVLFNTCSMRRLVNIKPVLSHFLYLDLGFFQGQSSARGSLLDMDWHKGKENEDEDEDMEHVDMWNRMP